MKLVLSKPVKIVGIPAWLRQISTVRAGLVVVLLVAAVFRFSGLNWDSGLKLHPDERFLTRVTNDLTWPENFSTYFDPKISTLSPYSLPDMGLFVYGTFPVYLVKWTAILLHLNNYDHIAQVGRVLSGLFDLGAIFFLFLIGRRLYGEKVGLLAAALLSLSVLNIQLSHFYTVDTFANLFVVATFFFLLRASAHGKWGDYALSGLLFGLGLASKVSILTLVVPILLVVGIDFIRRVRAGAAWTDAFERSGVRLLTVVVVAAFTFRLVQPIAFAGPSFWNWSFNPEWQSDLLEQGKIVTGNVDLPWLQQWTGRSPWFVVSNLVVWGLGIPLGLAAIAGLGLAGYQLAQQRMAQQSAEHLLPVVYVLVTFTYHAMTFVKFMRYFLPIYPFLALLAAYLIGQFWQTDSGEDPGEQAIESSRGSKFSQLFSRLRYSKGLAMGLAGVVMVGSLLYALTFSAIYSRPHTRIAASRWMYANIPAGSTLANEHWDDWLPLGGLDGKTAYGDDGLFQSVEMTNYEPDTPEKLNQMVDKLTKADYLILSSNRLYESIPRLPVRYPLTTRYYELLFKGGLGFERIAEFHSYPSFLGLQIPDQRAEESFTVYDHPRVQIFKKSSAFDPEALRSQLGKGIHWEAVLQLTPRQASAAPSGLRLLPADLQRYQQAAQWSSAEVSQGSLGSRMPVLSWVVVLLIIGLLAAPLTLVVFNRLADGGYPFSKAMGLLLVGWGAWMIASLRLTVFNVWLVLVMLILLAVASALVWRAKRATLVAFVQANWRLLLIEEGLFWGLFALGLFIRWANPDLWHPSLGGEKPMDLAYLTAVIRSPYFPPYDPWFSGGYINYYYFGFVLAAVFSHLTGIVPAVAYNLAVPMFFAMSAMGAFGVAFNLAEGWRKTRSAQSTDARSTGARSTDRHGTDGGALLAGVCGALFVTVIGNLGQVQLFFDGLRKLSVIKVEGNPSLPVMLAQFADGVGQWFNGQPLGFRSEWWYWNATRIIPPGTGEAGPINEMPVFSFLYGDLHAHVMALPYTLLVLALVLNLLRSALHGQQEDIAHHRRIDAGELVPLALLGLTIGSLRVMNTWDFPTYAAITAAGLALLSYTRRGRINLGLVWDVVWRMALVLLIGQIMFEPFHQVFASDYFGAQRWNGSRTPLWAYLLVHGFFLFMIASYLAAELLGGRGHNLVVRMLRFTLEHWRHPRRVVQVFQRLGRAVPGSRALISAGLVAFVLVLAVILVNRLAGLVLGMMLITVLLLVGRPEPRRQFVLFMTLLGLALTLLVEYVVLKGDVSRMNTVFKVYFQVWVLWALASAAVFPQLAARLRAVSAARRKLLGGWAPRDWWLAFGLLLAACLLYPLTAAPMRIRDRVEGSPGATLDGSAYMRWAQYRDQEQTFALDWDRQAIDWLRQNVRGIPVIVEANTPLYRWGGRVSIYSGLPAVIGWDWHEKQQRSILPGDLIDRRISDVRTIYTSSDLDETTRLLDQYNIHYIYAGPLEKIYYGEDHLKKFETNQGDLWHLVYQNEQVKIYEVK